MDVAVHPSKYFKVIEDDLFVNNHAIMTEAAEAVKVFQAKKYYEFGQIMGNILKIATEVEAQQPEALVVVAEQDQSIVDRKMMAEFVQGFLETTQVGEFNFTDLLMCIYETDQAALIMYQAVEIFE